MHPERRERWRATHFLTPDKKDLARFVWDDIAWPVCDMPYGYHRHWLCDPRPKFYSNLCNP